MTVAPLDRIADKATRIEVRSLEVLTGVKALENNRAIYYHRMAPLDLQFIRIYRLLPTRTDNVVSMCFPVIPPANTRYVAIGESTGEESMIILYGSTLDHKPQRHSAAIAYQQNEIRIAHQDVYKYLAKGYTPVATEG